MGTAFYLFSLVLFPSLFLMGLITFKRVLQSGIEDLIYACGITRIRQLYLEHAPQMQPYFILSAHDASGQPLLDVGIHPFWWQIFLTAAGMIAFINSMLAAVRPFHLAFAGLYECWSRDIPGELWNTTTLSMAAMEASGAEADSPLSKPTAIREAGKHSSSRFCSTTAFLLEAAECGLRVGYIASPCSLLQCFG